MQLISLKIKAKNEIVYPEGCSIKRVFVLDLVKVFVLDLNILDKINEDFI